MTTYRSDALLTHLLTHVLTREHFLVNLCYPATKPPVLRGVSMERMMGLEPTTFCMASRRSTS